MAGMGLAFAACLTEETDRKVVTMDVECEGSVMEYTLPDGKVGTGWQSYRDDLRAYFSDSSFDWLEVKIKNSPQCDIKYRATPEFSPSWWQKIPYTEYGVRVDYYGNKFVDACINRSGAVVNLMVNQMYVQKPIVDLHIIAYIEGGKYCLGFYNSGSFLNFCRKTCNPLPPANGNNRENQAQNDIEKTVQDVVIAAGVVAGTAWTIAKTVGPVIVEAFKTAVLAL